jgi:hypothetical protein
MGQAISASGITAKFAGFARHAYYPGEGHTHSFVDWNSKVEKNIIKTMQIGGSPLHQDPVCHSADVVNASQTPIISMEGAD